MRFFQSCTREDYQSQVHRFLEEKELKEAVEEEWVKQAEARKEAEKREDFGYTSFIIIIIILF